MKTKKTTENWPITLRRAAVGTLVAYSALGGKVVQTALAQTVAANGQATHHFSIPAGSLDTVLTAFEQTSGMTVSTTREGIRALPSPGVYGSYTDQQALEKLLTNTGLVYHFTSATNVSLDLRNLATSVEVAASVDALSTSSPKYSESPLEIAQTITAIPAQVLQEQGVTTLRDALRNVAGISIAAGEGGSQGDNLTIRGFTARNDLFIDGMRDFGSYYRDPFNYQEIEVLQGPSSVTFGRGSTGGVVNQATKTASLTRFVSGDLIFGTDLTRRLALDINTPVPKLGRTTAFRLNVMGNQNKVAGRDVAENRRFGVAPSLVFGLGTPTRWTFNYFHQGADDNPDYGIPWLFNGPSPVNRRNYYGFKKGNYLRTYDDIGTAKVEHDFNAHVTIRNQFRDANYVRHVLITEPAIAAGVTLATPLSAIQVVRKQLASDSTETYLGDQVDLSAHVETGFLRHNLVTGAELGRETSSPVRPAWTGIPNTSLLNPNPDEPFSGVAAPSTNVHTTANTVAAYVLDNVKVGSHWDFTGGFRWDRFSADYRQTVGVATAFHRVDQLPSWRAAIVYKPIPIGSIYFDAGTSFNPSAESLSLSAATANLPPEKNRTFEVGSKWDFPRNRLSLRGAVFQTTKLNAREPDPTNALLNVLAGTQRVNGVQVDVRGRINSRWDMLGGYAYLDATLIDSRAYPASIGARLANVPANTFNFWSTQRLPGGWDTGIGGNFVDSRTASATAPLDATTKLVKQVPSYWVFSAMAKHRLTEHIDLQVNLNNITNRYYYDQLHPGHIVLGAGRSALVALKFKF